MKSYPIEPVPAPRMTRSDKWKKRPCVLRYRAFRDEVRAHGVVIQNPCRVVFFLSMPPSWSEKKKLEMRGTPHRGKPDIDNLLKALFDAVFEDDAHIWSLRAEKIWALRGSIEVGILQA